MELFVKAINDIKLLIIFTKSFILDVWMGSKYTSAFWKYWKVKDFVIYLNTQLQFHHLNLNVYFKDIC